jgi:ribonuclease HII
MLILGIDEAGRGPVVGPMVIGGVLIEESLEKKLKKLGAKDSKQLTPAKREELEPKIRKMAKEVHFISIEASEIDEKRKRISLNELEAMKMAELIEKFENKPDRIIIDLPDPDGKMFERRIRKYIDLNAKIIAEHKADVNHVVVSAASIIAKVERDRAVREIEKKYGISLKTGYSHDPFTIEFLEKLEGEAPDFVRKSWETFKRITEKKFQKKLFDWD